MWYSAVRSLTRRVLIPALTLTFLVVATGCSSSSEEGPTGPNPPTGPLSFESVEQAHVDPGAVDESGDFEGEMVRVFRDQGAFESFWQDLHGENAEPPEIDFSEWYVVAAMLSEQPSDGYEADIRSITKNTNPTGVRVFVTTIEPGPNCDVSDSPVLPYHIVKVDRFSTDQVFFVDNGTESKDCG